jgi:glycosyltransferase involved in cell wall biosynthesis
MRLTLVHNSVGGSAGMGQVVAWMARTALKHGVELTVVASSVDPDIRVEARVVQLESLSYLPSSAWNVAWGVLARRAVRRSGTGVLHVHHPMLLDVANLMTCHHLARSGRMRGQREIGSGVEHVLREGQALMVRQLDDVLYKRRDRSVHMHFVSELLRDDFIRFYGQPLRSAVLSPPAPPARPVLAADQLAARRQFGIAGRKIVVGYLGGLDLRKGLAAVETLRAATDLELVVAGPNSSRITWPDVKVVGYVDADRLFEACDVIVAPSLFDAANLVVLQAVSRGLPVVVSDAVGFATDVNRHEAGIVWTPGEDLASAVRSAARIRPDTCFRMVDALSEESQSRALLRLWADCEEEMARR